ncbi:arsenite methyltransferase [Thermoplasmatota archaeon]
MEDKKIKKIVREGYGKIAEQGSTCCGPITSSCCGNLTSPNEISKNIGYTDAELTAVPDGSNLGLGCGNPTAIASLNEGEIVLDLGSGAGFDCFLAAQKVGETGKVIGVDMTSEMIRKARANAEKGNYKNVEFRMGEIEKLPVENKTVDVIISNCVINLSPDKKQVFDEAYRVLKTGGRLVISDIVLLKNLPDYIQNSFEAYVGCISGALIKDKYLKLIQEAGFKNITINDETFFPVELVINDSVAQDIIKKEKISTEEIEKIGNSIVSIKLTCTKP